MKFDQVERFAYYLDAYRVVPRILLFGYAALVWKASLWFMALPDPKTEQSAFVTLLAGFLVPLTNWYMQNGVDWSDRMGRNTTSTTTASTSTVVSGDNK
jgi:hypothetical protein